MRFIVGIIVFMPALVVGQIGGRSAYQSLDIANNPRSAALAGSTISLADGDISQLFNNPSTLDSVQVGTIFLHVNPYFADATFYSAAYTFNIGSLDGFAVGLNYFSFGEFEWTDDSGNVLGSFNASDYVLFLAKSHQWGPITLGASVKYLNSSIESFQSSALAFDAGGLFRVNKNWTFGMAFRNIGFTISDYTTNSPELPFDVVIGTTFKPEYMPLRFTLSSNNLADNNAELEENEAGRSSNSVDKALKRVNFGAEILFSEHFQLLVGYNHKRKQELRLDEIGGGAGLSFGLMVKIKRIAFRYSRAVFHAAGGSSFISLQTNLKEFKGIL